MSCTSQNPFGKHSEIEELQEVKEKRHMILHIVNFPICYACMRGLKIK